MATQIIRHPKTIAIPGASTIEGVGEFISAAGESLRLYIGAPFGIYAEGKLPESFSPSEKAVIDAYRWGIPLL